MDFDFSESCELVWWRASAGKIRTCFGSDDTTMFVGHVFDKDRKDSSFLLKGENNFLAFLEGKYNVKINMVVSSVVGEGAWIGSFLVPCKIFCCGS